MMLFGFYSQESSSKRYGQEAEEPELEPGPYSSKVRVLLSTLMPAINWSEPTSLMMLTFKVVFIYSKNYTFQSVVLTNVYPHVATTTTRLENNFHMPPCPFNPPLPHLINHIS